MAKEVGLFFEKSFRKQQIKAASEKVFDAVVVGGNLLGANIALELTRAGATTLLLAHEDFGSHDLPVETVTLATGLFAKKNNQAIEKLRLRSPHLFVPTLLVSPELRVHPEKLRYTKSKSLFGTGKKLSQQDLVRLNGSFDNDFYKGGRSKQSYKIDKCRFILDTVKTAAALGTTVLSYVEPVNFELTDGTTGVLQCTDNKMGEQIEFKAKQFIYSPERPNKNLQKLGTHEIKFKGIFQAFVSRKKLGFNTPQSFKMPEGNLAYAIPRREMVALHFSSSEFSEFECGHLKPSLHKAFNVYFPHVKLTSDDFRTQHFSYRPAIDFWDKGRLVQAAGNLHIGIAYRPDEILKTTASVLKKLNEKLGLKPNNSSITLQCAENLPSENINALLDYVDGKYDEAKSTGIPADVFNHLVFRYGSNIEWLTEQAYALQGQYPDWESKWAKAEVTYAVKFEGATSLDDYYKRRNTWYFCNPPMIEKTRKVAAETMATLLNWTEEEKQAELGLPLVSA